MNTINQAFGAVGNAVGSYMPLVEIASGLIKAIVEVYRAAEYNKKICRALAERVGITVAPLELLKIRHENELRDEVFYSAFYKFIYVLENIKEYINEVSKIHGFRKYAKAIVVREKFEKLTEDYDTAMKDLNFTLVIANEERRKNDEIALSEDLAEFEKYLSAIDSKADNIYEEVKYIRKHLDDKTFHGANKIDSKSLLLPARGKPDNRRGKFPNFVEKRTLNGQEVACKLTSTTDEEMESNTRVQGHLEILMKLSTCNHILRFYGVSKIDETNAMVFEWAQRGTLKELYELKDIQWHYKVQIALKICRGLIFLQSAEILHHDLRCENILMTESLEPKIYNFKLARHTFDKTTTLKGEINDAVHKIRDFVIKGGRERIKFGNSTSEISKLQEAYKQIIDDTWKNNPQEHDFTVPAIPLDEGIQAHKKGEYQKAWNCFEYHAKNGNTLAKCWKGRYLWDGYLDGIKERDDGRKLLKEAADEGHADAQLFYAFTLKKSMNEGKNIDTFIDYITKAAKGNNEVAQYNLGDIYYKGKLNIPKDEKEGIRWLKMAAL
ncbi:22393_t:CDS:2, partial [Rhizophagus irregularis]